MFFSGEYKSKRKVGAITLSAFLLSSSAFSKGQEITDPSQLEKNAKQKLAEKLTKVSESYAVKEARYQKDPQGNFDRNTGNPSDANTTYHSYVWDYCLQLAGSGNCKKWLDPYVSKHGLESDNEGQSPLENKVASLWQQSKKDGDKGQGGSYGIWDIQTKGNGSAVDEQGRLDRTQLTKFQLKKNVTEEIEQIGYKTATSSIAVSYDENDPQNTLPNLESMRLMAGRWTRMMRNRLVANLGELRAADKGIEFALGEDLADCDKYLTALNKVPDEVDKERIKYQGQLDPETNAAAIQQRYELCMQARNASVYMVNAKVSDGKIKPGSANDEQIDKWRNRVNIAAIDYGGINLDSLPKPANQQLTEEEKKSELGDWNEGGTAMRSIRMSNAEQIESYNKQLRDAAQGMKEVAARTQFVPDASQEILKHEIKPGTMSLVEINGLTKEMKNSLKDTDAPGVKPVQNNANPNPDRNYEETPSQLTVTAAR